MRNLFQFLFLIVFATISWAQVEWSAPDYKSIKKEINDKKSIYFYPNLIEKLENGTTDLSREDFKHLYYGYRYQGSYNPYASTETEKQIEEKLKNDLQVEDIQEITALIPKALKENPINLKLYLYASYFNNQLGNTEKADVMMQTYFGFIIAILTSGDGQSCETAFHVLSVHDEYELLGALELKSKGQALVGNCDLLQLADNNDGIEKLYFNISVPFETMSSLFK